MILLLLVAATAPLDSIYETGDYDKVVQLAPSFLADSARTPADSESIDLTYASALTALGRTGEAAGVFRHLLTRNPDLTLNPEAVSPKIRTIFDAVKTEMILPSPLHEETPVETVYRRQPLPLDVLVPGLHQIGSGRLAAGYAIAGATALSLAGLVLSHFEYSGAHAEYLNATTPQDIADRYRVANDWSHARIVLSGTTAALWLTGLITSFRSP